MLIGIDFFLLEANVSNFLEIGFFSWQLRSHLTLLPTIRYLCRRSLLILDFALEILLDRLGLKEYFLLNLRPTATGFEFGDKPNIEFLLPLLLNFAHFLVLHPLNNVQLLLLFDPLLILIPLLHEFFHIVVDIFIDYMQLIKMGLMPCFFLSLQSFH